MNTTGITPILNVSDMAQSFAWFEAIGWKKGWDWGEPTTFGCVYAGENTQVFLCLSAQGGRGKGDNTATFGQANGETADKGVWLSIWVDNVDSIYQKLQHTDVEIMHTPENMPWNVRELHIRHPDGHVFRLSQTIEPS